MEEIIKLFLHNKENLDRIHRRMQNNVNLNNKKKNQTNKPTQPNNPDNKNLFIKIAQNEFIQFMNRNNIVITDLGKNRALEYIQQIYEIATKIINP